MKLIKRKKQRDTLIKRYVSKMNKAIRLIKRHPESGKKQLIEAHKIVEQIENIC